MLNEPAPGANVPAAGGGGGGGGANPPAAPQGGPAQQYIQVTPAERTAIDNVSKIIRRAYLLQFCTAVCDGKSAWFTNELVCVRPTPSYELCSCECHTY